MSESKDFRDEEPLEPPAISDARAIDPYRSPTAAQFVTADSPTGGLPPRVSPIWAFLIGQTPYHLTFWSMFLAGGTESSERFLSALFDAATIDVVSYSARTFWLGPGRAAIRAPVVIACLASAAMLPGWIPALTGNDFRGIGLFVTAEFAVLLALQSIVALGVGAIFFACGSRDVSQGERSPIGWLDVSAAIFAAAVFLFAAVPFLAVVGADFAAQSEGVMRRGFADAALQPMIAVVLFTCLSVNWRVGVRGLRRIVSWTSLSFAIVASLWIGFASLVSFGTLIADETSLRLDALAPLAALVALPIAREFFLRFVGYRAINVYAEKRRRTKDALAAEPADEVADCRG